MQDSQTNNIFLVGPMGAGKTSVGKLLAKILNVPFFDSDQVIEAQTGADIPWIFDVEGEEGFRKREEKIVDDLSKKKGLFSQRGVEWYLRLIIVVILLGEEQLFICMSVSRSN